MLEQYAQGHPTPELVFQIAEDIEELPCIYYKAQNRTTKMIVHRNFDNFDSQVRDAFNKHLQRGLTPEEAISKVEYAFNFLTLEHAQLFIDFIEIYLNCGGRPDVIISLAYYKHSSIDVRLLVVLYWRDPEADWEIATKNRFEKLIKRILKDEEAFDESVSKGLLSLVDSYLVDEFILIANFYLERGGDPNRLFPCHCIERTEFKNLTFFHLVYLFWKLPSWDPEIMDDLNLRFEKLIDNILADARTNLRARFTEHRGNKKGSRFIGEDILYERMNLAHFAAKIEDVRTVAKVVEKDPYLLKTKCCYTKNKNSVERAFDYDGDSDGETRLDSINVTSMIQLPLSPNGNPLTINIANNADYGEIRDNLSNINNLEIENDEIAGDLVTLEPSYRTERAITISRTAKFTLAHIAATVQSEAISWFLRGKGANVMEPDSNQRLPLHYINLPQGRGVNQALITALRPVEGITKPVLPRVVTNLFRSEYTCTYDMNIKGVKYAYQRLTKESLKKVATRQDQFQLDAEVPLRGQAVNADFVKTGYDRGHMVPAADATSSELAMSESFLLTNVLPQLSNLNRGYWKKLENYIRDLVKTNDMVEVFTGPAFVPVKKKDGTTWVTYPVIGEGNIAVATHFFKVIYMHKRGQTRSFALLIPHRKISSDTPFENFRVPIDQVQQVTGIQFDEWRNQGQ